MASSPSNPLGVRDLGNNIKKEEKKKKEREREGKGKRGESQDASLIGVFVQLKLALQSIINWVEIEGG